MSKREFDDKDATTEGVIVMATGYQDTVNTLADGVDKTTVTLALATGEYIRVYLDNFGRYRVWLGNMQVMNDGALMARGALTNDVARRLMERKDLRERYDKLCERGESVEFCNDWLAAMTHSHDIQAESLDYGDLMTWDEEGGNRASLPQRFRNLWRRLTGS